MQCVLKWALVLPGPGPLATVVTEILNRNTHVRLFLNSITASWQTKLHCFREHGERNLISIWYKVQVQAH